MADKIFIENLVVPVLIGCRPEERREPQALIISIEFLVSTLSAGQADDLKQTIDYSEVRRLVINEVSNSDYHLLEALAEHLANTLHQQFKSPKITIKLRKTPEDMPDVAYAGVEIVREYSKASEGMRNAAYVEAEIAS